MLPNRLNVTISDQTAKDVTKHITDAIALLPFLITLTSDERQQMQSINNSNKTFTEDVIAQMHAMGNVLPPYLSAADIETDLNAFKVLDGIIPALEKFVEQLKDTRQVAGFEAYNAALAFYRLLDALEKASVPGAKAAKDALKIRFAAQGNFKKKTDTKTVMTE